MNILPTMDILLAALKNKLIPVSIQSARDVTMFEFEFDVRTSNVFAKFEIGQMF